MIGIEKNEDGSALRANGVSNPAGMRTNHENRERAAGGRSLQRLVRPFRVSHAGNVALGNLEDIARLRQRCRTLWRALLSIRLVR